MRYLERIPLRSWRYKVSGLKAIWLYGIGLPFPIDEKKDLPKLPRVRRGPRRRTALLNSGTRPSCMSATFM